jgi:hypothetical protein
VSPKQEQLAWASVLSLEGQAGRHRSSEEAAFSNRAKTFAQTFAHLRRREVSLGDLR